MKNALIFNQSEAHDFFFMCIIRDLTITSSFDNQRTLQITTILNKPA